MKNKKFLATIIAFVFYTIIIILLYVYELYLLICLIFSVTAFSLFIVNYMEARKHRHDISERKLYIDPLIDSIHCLTLFIYFVFVGILIYYNPFSRLATYIVVVCATILMYIMGKINDSVKNKERKYK